MTKKVADQIKRIIGSLLTIIALVFVGKSIWLQRNFLLNIDSRIILKTIPLGVLIYFIADIILATAWKMLLNWFGEGHLSFLKSVEVYGKSQILKYIPGNLLSIPGRHMLSLQYGAEHGPLVGAATLEIVGLLAMSSTISIVGYLFVWNESTKLFLWFVLIIFMLSLAGPFILRYVLSHEAVSKRLSIFKMMTWGKYTHLIAIWLLYSGFFIITGFILLWIIVIALGKWDAISFYIALITFTVSWLLGTITPGAPAGVGVRESVIILALSIYIGEQSSILVSLLLRIVTVVADVIFYFSGLYLEKFG